LKRSEIHHAAVDRIANQPLLWYSARLIGFFLLASVLILPARAQNAATGSPGRGDVASFFAGWDERALGAQVDQPNWLTPVVTSTARLKQEIRYDLSWQRNSDGSTTENYGGSKGFTTIPIDRVEISLNLPPYFVHNEPHVYDGFGDFSILTKFRILAANRAHGDYALTAFLAVTFPTGSYKNGSPHPVITPTIAGGKGLGDFVYQGTFGCDLPSAQSALLGRRIIQNSAFQYRGWGKVWPEIEANSNFYSEGPNHGKKQLYLTPGISAGRFPLYRNLTLSLGAGMQFAVTHSHSYTHQAVFTVRLPF
jgi:hypothetical protein